MHTTAFWVIIISIGVLLLLSWLVYTGHLQQKGPRRPGGPLGPPL